MTAQGVHPLLIGGGRITEKTAIWKLKQHPYTPFGARRGFEVRVYHYPTEGWDPYFITVISRQGWVMDAAHSPTAEAAQSAAHELLDSLTNAGGTCCRPSAAAFAPPQTANLRAERAGAGAGRFQAHADRVEPLSAALIEMLEAEGANYPQATLALTRVLGAIIGANARSDADRAAALSVAARAVAGCAESAPLIAGYGRRLRPIRSRLN